MSDGMHSETALGSVLQIDGESGVSGRAGTSQTFLNKWTRVERNLQSDITTLWPGRTLATITGIYLYDGQDATDTIKLDELAISNSLTEPLP